MKSDALSIHGSNEFSSLTAAPPRCSGSSKLKKPPFKRLKEFEKTIFDSKKHFFYQVQSIKDNKQFYINEWGMYETDINGKKVIVFLEDEKDEGIPYCIKFRYNY